VGSAIKIEENGSSLKFLVNKDFVKTIPEDEAVSDWIEFPLSNLSRVSIQTAENTLKNRMNERVRKRPLSE